MSFGHTRARASYGTAPDGRKSLQTIEMKGFAKKAPVGAKVIDPSKVKVIP
jgi:hypothetical protein